MAIETAPAAPVATAAPSAPWQSADLCPTDPRGGNRTVRIGNNSMSGHISTRNGESTTVLWTGRDCAVTIRLKGRVTFNEAEDDVASLGAGDSFEITHDDGKRERSYQVRQRNGGLERTYRIDGRDATLDEAARAWRGDLVLAFIRRSGYEAEARVARIRRQGGFAALEAEIALIPSDGVRARYLTAAFQDRALSPADASRLLARSAAIGSDGDLSSVLATVPPALLADAGVQRAFAAAAETIGSDGDLSSVLIGVLRTGRLDAAACEWVLGLTGTIGSDGDRSQVLTTASASLPADSRCLGRAIALTAEIGSSGDKSATLMRIIEDHGLPRALLDPFFRASATIRSDGDHAALLHRVIDVPDLGEAGTVALLTDARSIRSDGDLSAVLVAAARRRLIGTAAARDAYLAATETIRSQGDRESALRAIGATDRR